ncbi:hypothetical protein [Spirosoma spitsbergense]|uniref:hypothetical protein n=1 Tax=Spirosoma spitsbergense TaxID=431554 RepID=UPI00036BA608|nr:hypothetical protein [Spirosoma spitsbergense]
MRQHIIYDDGLLTGLFSEEQVRAMYNQPTPVPPPAPAKKPVFGHPRTQVGIRDNLPVFSSAATKGVFLRITENPDAIVPKGANMAYDVLPGVKKLTGEETGNYGQDAPKGFVKPDGYRVRYFGGRKDEPYYEQSDLPDEQPTGTILTTNTHSLSAQNFTGHYGIVRTEN